MATDLRQSELIKRIASVVGHELRNPLAVINNSSYFVRTKLGSGGALDPKVEKHLGIVASEVARADRLIADLLAYSRPLELVKTRKALADVVAAAVDSLDRPAGVKVVVKPMKDSLEADVDCAKLAEAARRLLENAVEAAAPSGTVTVTVGRDKGFSFIEVRDTGPGIKQEILRSLFEPFFTGKPRGLGLGLALARKIAQAHGGRAEGGNAPDGGARFRLLVPHGR